MPGTASINGKYEDSDDDSDWDRYSYGEEDKYSSGGTVSIGGRPLDSNGPRRVAESSIFGLTEKRRPEPLRCALGRAAQVL